MKAGPAQVDRYRRPGSALGGHIGSSDIGGITVNTAADGITAGSRGPAAGYIKGQAG